MAPKNLRERRRRQTAADIQRTTIRLVRERGFDKVTIEEISTEAGISPRTFFNYFPNKESAIAWAPLELNNEHAARFIEAGPAPDRQILDDAVGLTIAEISENPPSRELFSDLGQIAKTSPAVTAAMLAQYEQFQQRLAALVAQRIGAQPTDEIPDLIATLALTLIRTGIDRWAGGEHHKEETPTQHVLRAAELIQNIFAGRPKR